VSTLSIFCLRVRVKLFEAIYLSAGRFSYNTDNAAEKEKHQKDRIRAKRIISNLIKDHLILYLSSKKTLKEMFNVLTRLYEGKNIN
jgi:hypothetical protein